MKIELPEAIIGRKYKEGSCSMKFEWKNLFKKEETNQSTSEKELNQYYDRTKIDETNASYRLIIGQRSNRQDIQCIENNSRELY